MRYLAIGDIHGCSIALEALLDVVDPYHYDRLITLGDYINKGPDTKGTLERLISLYERGLLIPLRGNHEQKMRVAKKLQAQALEDDVLIDQHTMNSYGVHEPEGWIERIPEHHWNFIEFACLDYWEGEDIFCVHATADPLKHLSEQTSQGLFYEKFANPAPHVSGKTMICGHTPQKNGLPLSNGHAVCIDTMACGGQWLTGLDMQTGQFWQANQQGQTRTGMLPRFRKTSQWSKSSSNQGCVCDHKKLKKIPEYSIQA